MGHSPTTQSQERTTREISNNKPEAKRSGKNHHKGTRGTMTTKSHRQQGPGKKVMEGKTNTNHNKMARVMEATAGE